MNPSSQTIRRLFTDRRLHPRQMDSFLGHERTWRQLAHHAQELIDVPCCVNHFDDKGKARIRVGKASGTNPSRRPKSFDASPHRCADDAHFQSLVQQDFMEAMMMVTIVLTKEDHDADCLFVE